MMLGRNFMILGLNFCDARLLLTHLVLLELVSGG